MSGEHKHRDDKQRGREDLEDMGGHDPVPQAVQRHQQRLPQKVDHLHPEEQHKTSLQSHRHKGTKGQNPIYSRGKTRLPHSSPNQLDDPSHRRPGPF